jgi:hypothetical protein
VSKWEPPEGRCRCGRTIEVLERWCRQCAAKEADWLVGHFVKRRDGGCVVQGCRSHHFRDWAHIHAKGSHPKLRWDATNAVTLCRDHHEYFGLNPRVWRDFIEEYAPGLWDELLEREQKAPRVDLGEVITKFKAVAA